ncbi:MAG: LysR family transcriptional regulator [Rhizobiaceae bacterium]
MRNLTLRHLRSLVAVAQTSRISIAAVELGLTGPAITLQLKQMEEDAGIALFDRTSEGMRLTAAGAILLEAAHAIQDRLRQADDALEMLKTGKRGTLRLGAVSTAKYFVPRMMAAFRRENPDIQIELKIGNRAQTIEALRNQEVDVSLMGRPPQQIETRALVFGDHPFVIIAAPDHPLAGKLDITKEQLVPEHFLLRESGSGTRTALEFFFGDIPKKLEGLGAEMGSNETIKQAVMAGLGIAFISAHTIEQELVARKLVILDVIGMPIRRQWFSIVRADRSMPPATEAFNRFLSTRGAQFLPVIGKIYPKQQA